jgi:hypothetical protein
MPGGPAAGTIAGMDLAQTREALLAEVRVAVLGVADPRGDSGPLLVPFW